MVRHQLVSGRSGFTLLELLIVLAVVSIGLAMAVPKVQAISTRQRVDRTAHTVAADIRSAFTSAARGRVPVRLAVPGGAATYAVINQVTGDTIRRRDFTLNGVQITAQSGNGLRMDVYPNGVSTGADTINVVTSSYTRRVSVSRVGFVRVLPLP